MKRHLLASFVAFAAFALTTSAKITSATYNLSAFVPSGSNLILGKQPSYSSNAGTHAESTGGLSAITDGRVGDTLATDVCAIGANGVLEYTLGDSPNGYDIKEIRFYTYWPDSTHNGIQLADFSTKAPGNNTFSHVGIDGYNLNYGDANARAFVRYHRSNAADNLVTGVSAIRFDFGDLSAYGGLCPIVEIEVIGQSYDYPSATLTSIFADSSSLHFVGSLLSPASGATSASFQVAIAPVGESLPSPTTYQSGLTDGNALSVTIPGLRWGTTYQYEARVVNNLGYSGDCVWSGTVTIPDEETCIADPGLYQGLLTGNFNLADSMAAATNVRRELGPVMGLYLATDVATQPYTSEIDGVSSYWAANSTYLYTGCIYLVAGTTYAFGAYVDDSQYLSLERTVILQSTGTCQLQTGTYTAVRTGWHSLEIRLGNGGGWAGNYGNPGVLNGFGLAYNSQGVTDAASGVWQILKDPGNGSLLRTHVSDGSLRTVAANLASGGGSAILSVDVPAPADIYAWYGNMYGGNEAANWEHAVKVGEVQGGAEEFFLASVPFGASAPAFLRFAAITKGATELETWPRFATFTLEPADWHVAGASPTLVQTDVTSDSPTSVPLSVNLLANGGTAASCDLFLSYGASADALTTTQQVATAATPGTVSTTLSGLLPGRTYYARSIAVNSDGATGASEIFTFATAALVERDASYPGLAQGTLAGDFDTTGTLDDATNVCLQDRPAMAYISDSGAHTIPCTSLDGVTTYWTDHTTYLYTGYIHLVGGTSYAFGSYIDDSALLVIGGTTIIDKPALGDARGDYTAATTGWYPIEIRLGNQTSTAGAMVNANWPDFFGIVYAPGETRALSRSGTGKWKPLADPGDGSFLRQDVLGTAMSAVRVRSVLRDGDSLHATILVDMPVASDVYAWYGDTYGGGDAAGWNTRLVGSVAGGDSESLLLDLDFNGALPNLIRFAAVSRDDPWYKRLSATVVVPDQPAVAAEPVVTGTSVVSDFPDRGTLSVGILSVGTGASSSSLALAYGTAPEALTATNVVAASGLVAGGYAATLSGLLPGKLYYMRAIAVNDLDATGVSDVFTLSTATLSEAGSGGTVGGTVPGLRQARLSIATGAQPDLSLRMEDIAASDPASIDHTLGALMGVKANVDARSGSDAVSQTWTWTANTLYYYEGEVHLAGGTPFYVFSRLKDGGAVYIDDNCLVAQGATSGGSAEPATILYDWTPAATGWYPIRIYFWSWDGNPSVAKGIAGAQWSVEPSVREANKYGQRGNDRGEVWFNFLDSGDGSFLRYVLNSRTIEVVSASLDPDAHTVDASLAFSTASTAWQLTAFYGAGYGGTDTNAWEHSADLGAIAADATAKTVEDLAVAPGTQYLRFRLTAPGVAPIWSTTTVFLPANNPTLGEASATETWRGDAVRLNGSLVTTGGSVCTVTVEVSDDSELANAFVWPVGTLSESGDFSVLVGTNDTESAAYIVPGGTYYYRFIAVNAEGGADTTPISSFTTSAGSTLVPTATVSRDQRTVTFSGSLSRQGANDTTVWLYAYIGDVGDTFAPMGDPIVIHPGDTTDFSVPVTVPAFDDRVVGYFVCSNACGTVAWGDRTSGSVEIRARDFANYQWKPEVAEGDWADPANWIPSKADNVGYPGNPICDGKYASAGFDLCAGKTIVVNMAASYNLAGTSYLAENASITLVKASNATPVLTNGETFDLRASDLTLTLDGIDVNNNMWTLDNNSLTATNVTLRLTNGARVVNSAYSYFCGHGYRLLLDHGSFYGVGRTLSIGGRDMVVDIDDSQVYAGWLVELDRTVHGEGHAIHFRGDHPQLFTDRNMGLATGTYGCSFVFHVPAFGYTAVPVRSLAAAGAADTVAFGATRSAGNETPITVALAKDSPRHTSGNDSDVLLFDFPGFGIDRTAVALGSVPSRTDGFYYVDDASATPAQLWVHCEPHGATVLILQ